MIKIQKKLLSVTLQKSESWQDMSDGADELDLFTMSGNPSPEQQREFELFWKKMTGRMAIVVPDGIEFKGTFKYPKDG